MVGFWLARIQFSRREQLLLLVRLSSMLRAELPLRTIFDLILKFPCNAAEYRIAKLSLASISRGHPFSSGYAAAGWYPPQVASLLEAGEEHNCLPGGIRIARQYYEEGLKPWHLIFRNNLRWFISVGIVLLLCIFLQTQQSLFEQVLGTPESFRQRFIFWVGSALREWGLIFLAGCTALIAGLIWQLRSGTSKLRRALDRVIIFREYRQAFVQRVVAEMAAFLEVGTGHLATIDTLLKIYSSGYRHLCLKEVKYQLVAGMDLAEALGRTLLAGRYSALVNTLMVSFPGNSDQALNRLSEVMNGDSEVHYRRIGYSVGFGCMLLLFLLVYSLLELIYGAPLPLQ